MYDKLGQTVLVVFGDCARSDILNDAKQMEEVFEQACSLAGTQVLNSSREQFFRGEWWTEKVNDGASVTITLAESHAFGHSWPRKRTLVCNIHTCGGIDPMRIVRQIAFSVGAKRFKHANIDLDALAENADVPWVSGDS